MFKLVDEAQRVAVELRELIEKGIYKKSIRIYHLLMEVIEFEKRNISKAIEYLEKAVRSLPYQDSFSRFHAIFIYSLALAYYEAKDLDKALEEYKRIVSLTTGRLNWGDTAKAIEFYEIFLDLWKNADPGIAEVEYAIPLNPQFDTLLYNDYPTNFKQIRRSLIRLPRSKNHCYL